MSWATLDDGFADHPKVLPLSSDAFRLHICAMCWCNRRGTDGKLAKRDLRILGGMLPAPRDTSRDTAGDAHADVDLLVAELVHARLWDILDDGWALHDFLDWNEPAAKVKAKRDAHARRQKALRDKARTERDQVRAAACDETRDAACDTARASTHPIPSHIKISHTPAQVRPGNTKAKPCPDDDAVQAWKAIETGAGGPQGLGIDRKPGGTQELWLDDNRAMLWCQNWRTLRQADPPYTLADCEKLGRWIAAGGTGDFKTPWQMLSKAGKAPDIGAWFAQALRWDPMSDPRAKQPPSRFTAAAPALPPRVYAESTAKRQADAIERGELPEVDPAVVAEQLRKMQEVTA